MSDRQVPTRLLNWAGNITFGPHVLHRPAALEELCALVSGAERVHALGTGHSFSEVADSPGVLVSVADLPPSIEIDPVASTVTVGGGVRWGELAPLVDAAGFALPNMGSLPHISIAGSAATGTHGSGDHNGCLATAVAGLELVTATGAVLRINRSDPDLAGAVVALGALGVVSRVTLDLQPTYDVRQVVYEDLGWVEGLGALDEIFASAYSVSLFTRWSGAGFEQVWVKQRTDHGAAAVDLAWKGAVAAEAPRHPVPGADAVHCTEQGGVVGPWYARLPHFRLQFTPSSGDELQTEYLVPREHGVAALEAVNRIRDLIAPVLQISEIRTVAGDNLWLSPCYGRESLAIHFTWLPDIEVVRPVVEAVEAALSPFGARPHWGKVFAMEPERVADLYPRLADFRALAERLDPAGKFVNAFAERYVRGTS